jgi:hypothetical protein
MHRSIMRPVGFGRIGSKITHALSNYFGYTVPLPTFRTSKAGDRLIWRT